MILRPSLRRAAAFAATAALALQALWPLLAQARPGDTLQVPLCSAQGATHAPAIAVGKTTPLDERAASHGEHCKLCVFGAEKPVAAVSLGPFFLSLPSRNDKASSGKAKQHHQSGFATPAQPRAPPQVS